MMSNVNVRNQKMEKPKPRPNKAAPAKSTSAISASWQDQLAEELIYRQLALLDLLGVRSSQEIFNLVTNKRGLEVYRATKLYRHLYALGEIADPRETFATILRHGYADRGSTLALKKEPLPNLRKAIFNYWLELASEFGFYDRFEEREGKRYVRFGPRGKELKFNQAWNSGHNLMFFHTLLELDV